MHTQRSQTMPAHVTKQCCVLALIRSWFCFFMARRTTSLAIQSQLHSPHRFAKDNCVLPQSDDNGVRKGHEHGATMVLGRSRRQAHQPGQWVIVEVRMMTSLCIYVSKNSASPEESRRIIASTAYYLDQNNVGKGRRLFRRIAKVYEKGIQTCIIRGTL